MDWVLLTLGVLGLPLLWTVLLPGQGGVGARVRSAVAAALERVAVRVRGRRSIPPDPFAALHVQMRLSALSRELQWLEQAPAVYARAHRIAVARAAYDDLLLEACLLAGVEVPPDARRGASERWREEAELTERGWSW